MTGFLRVKNIDEFQAYKDGRPIHWIKLHLLLLDDYDFNQLPEVSQIHLVKIWLYAARNENRVENDPVWIGSRINAKSKVDLNQLVTAGFLIPYETVQDRTDSYLEERREEERREGTDVPNCPHQEVIAAYHEILPELPSIVLARWSGSESERNLRTRWRENKEHQNLDFWRGFFSSVRANDWWMGRDKWKGVDLHWLLKRTNFDKVVQNWANGVAA